MPLHGEQKFRAIGRYRLLSSGVMEQRMQDVAKLYFGEGLQIEDICQQLNLTPRQAYYCIKEARAEWFESRLASVDTWFRENLASLEFVEEQAVEGWFRSIGKTKKVATRKDSAGAVIESMETEENLVGDPRFLSQIQDVVAKRNKMLGLDAPDRLVVDTMEHRLVALIKDGKVTYEMLLKDAGPNLANKYFNLAGVAVPKLLQTDESNIIEGTIIGDELDEEANRYFEEYE